MSVDVAQVSVVIPCYRCANTIRRAVNSIEQQSQKPFEVILVDDASGDDTLSVLYELEKQYNGWVKIIAMPENKGAASARNKGWNIASQLYIAFLDADDAWHPQKIEIQYGWMIENEEYGLVGHDHLMLKNQNDMWPLIADMSSLKPIRAINALFSNPFSTITVMLKRDLTFRFAEGKRYAEDYFLWLEIIFSGIPTMYFDQKLAATFKYDYGFSGLSGQLWKMEKGELDNYWQMYKKGYIYFILMFLVSIYSFVKYLRRFVVIKLREMN